MPASQNKKLVALWVTDPEAAAFECRLALIRHDHNVMAAAASLQVSRQALHGWIRKHPTLFARKVAS